MSDFIFLSLEIIILKTDYVFTLDFHVLVAPMQKCRVINLTGYCACVHHPNKQFRLSPEVSKASWIFYFPNGNDHQNDHLGSLKSLPCCHQLYKGVCKVLWI
jgi:hypothetical protein